MTADAPPPTSDAGIAGRDRQPGGAHERARRIAIAVTRAQHDPATKAYLARKMAEGKTNKSALRSLKRHLARRFHHLLSEPPADHQPTPQPEAIIKPKLPAIPDRPNPHREIEQVTAAPCPMICIS